MIELKFVLGRDLNPFFPLFQCECECVSQLLNDELTSIYIFSNRHTEFISNPKSTPHNCKFNGILCWKQQQSFPIWIYIYTWAWSNRIVFIMWSHSPNSHVVCLFSFHLIAILECLCWVVLGWVAAVCVAATKCKCRHIIHATILFHRQLQFDALLLFWCAASLFLYSFIFFLKVSLCTQANMYTHTHEFRTIWINKFCIFANSTMEYTSFNNCRWRYAALMWNNERTNDRPKKTYIECSIKGTYMLKHYIAKYTTFFQHFYDTVQNPVLKIHFSPNHSYIVASAITMLLLLWEMSKFKGFWLNLIRTKNA